MNRNSIISLAMLYALWQSNRKDLLALIHPFVLYAVGTTTKVGDKIDIPCVCACMEQEFGYRSFQSSVASKILNRETSSSIKAENRTIAKKNRSYYLVNSLTDQIEEFRNNRTRCKERTDAVSNALADFLNNVRACKRADFTKDNTEPLLLAFFEKQGGSVVLSVEDLRQLTSKSNEIDYYIGLFILSENERQSHLMDYIVELVKGYFITTALYLQAENPNVTSASFKEVTFFLDTRLLLAYLGYKSKEENDSVQEMVRSLQRNGAKLACFSYNVEEVNNILEAYKMSTIYPSKRPTTTTLEFFDENLSGYTQVEISQRYFQGKLDQGGIQCFAPADVLDFYAVFDQPNGILNDERIQEILREINPKYNLSTLPDDLTALNTVSRVRNSENLPNIEKCKAVFVTSNAALVAATHKHLKEISSDPGFPIAITGDDLCVIAWLKDFDQNNRLPKMRLLENVLAAITPTNELMDAYFENLALLEAQGELPSDEAILLRVDMFARKELMRLTHGERNNVTPSIILSIRQSLRADGLQQGIAQGVQQGRLERTREVNAQKNAQRNAVCKRAEDEVRSEYQQKTKCAVFTIKLFSALIAAVFIAASYFVFTTQDVGPIKWAFLIVTAITTVQGAWPFLKGDTWIISYAKKRLRQAETRAADEKKEHYLSLIGEDE